MPARSTSAGGYVAPLGCGWPNELYDRLTPCLQGESRKDRLSILATTPVQHDLSNIAEAFDEDRMPSRFWRQKLLATNPLVVLVKQWLPPPIMATMNHEHCAAGLVSSPV